MKYLKEMIKQSYALVVSVAIFVSSLQATENSPRTIIQPSQPPLQTSLPLEAQFQGLYTTFAPGYKYLSPVSGMLSLVSERLTNVRFKGHYGEQNSQYLCHYQITNPAEGNLPTSEIDCPQDHTSAIVHTLS